MVALAALAAVTVTMTMTVAVAVTMAVTAFTAALRGRKARCLMAMTSASSTADMRIMLLLPVSPRCTVGATKPACTQDGDGSGTNRAEQGRGAAFGQCGAGASITATPTSSATAAQWYRRSGGARSHANRRIGAEIAATA